MRVGWLTDESSHVGGAELTQAEFRAAAPKDVEIVDCPATCVVEGLDTYVVHNCVTYTEEDIEAADGPIVKYWHDVGPHLHPGVRELLASAEHICCSPVQAKYMGFKDVALIPPPVNLERFEQAAAESNGNRAGACCIASWRNYGKGPNRVVEWGEQNRIHVDFYGNGQLAPAGAQEVSQELMPALLARYERFVFLPTVIEPFGRLVVEASYAGCEVTTNSLVGAKWWLEENDEALKTAAVDFWASVLR